MRGFLFRFLVSSPHMRFGYALAWLGSGLGLAPGLAVAVALAWALAFRVVSSHCLFLEIERVGCCVNISAPN